ncbi:ATP-binding cassette domain-containing protein [Pedobacter cryotolerans]|uniref:ATP-binding cassette domain-containing protein n=1 Tax=Pedobacter cryotolerans TaxID=2571270 RepID=UPI00197E59EC|nr:ABC transporter ATP-binding protein [Pedobacter cryotolerans]
MQIIEKIQQKIFVEYAIAFAEKLPKIDVSKNKKYYLPELVNRFFDTQNLQKGISKILLEIPSALIQILFGILLLSFYHTWFLVFGAFVVVIVIIIFSFTMDDGIRSSIDESAKKYKVACWLEDVAGAIKTFKIYSKTQMHLSGTDERVVEYLECRTQHFRVLIFQYEAIIGFKVVITLVMLAIGTYLLVDQKLNIGAFIATEIVVLSIMAAVEKLIISLESYYDVVASLDKLGKVTGLTEEHNENIVLESKIAGMEVTFTEVEFSFTDQKPILSNINFNIQPNTITLITGSLGSGKSLLMNMMAGFYDPSNGSVLFDKIPLKNMDKVSLRDHIGMYMDDMQIIKGTLEDNILLGRQNIGTDGLLEVSEAIGLDNLSGTFTKGFNTHLSKTDTEISFSSRKKILILRALLGDKRLLLLEHPLTGMNAEFCKRMVNYLQEAKERMTIVIISDDPSLVSIADQSLHLQNGTLYKM